MMRWSSFQECS